MWTDLSSEAKKAPPAGVSIPPSDTSQFPGNFFGALNQGNDDEALRFLRNEALPDGRTPSPRAEEFIKTGEWDSRTKVPLVLLDGDSCGGHVGDSTGRVCSKPSKACTAQTHRKNPHKLAPGWYISLGGKSGHALTEPFLPAEGGPIRSRGAGRLTDGEGKFTLTVGQWKFVLDSWRATTVETLSDTPSEEDQVNQPATSQKDNPTLDDAPTPLLQADSPFDFEDASEDEDPVQQQTEAMARLFRDFTKKRDDLEARMRMFEARAEAYQRRAESAEGKQADSQRHLQLLHTRMLQLEARAAQPGANGGERMAQLDRLLFDVYDQQGALMMFRSQFSEFREKLESGGGIDCNGVSFASKREFLAWYDDKGASVSLFMDALAQLHSIRPAVMHHDVVTKQWEIQAKNSIDTDLEETVMTSFYSVVPSVLVGGKRVSDHGTSGAYDWLQTTLKSYAVWKPRGRLTGVSHQILEGIDTVKKRAIDLRAQKSTDTEVVLLASGLCTDSGQFCKELVGFMTDQYEELTADTSYSPEEVWSMQLDCLQTILKELSAARASVTDAARHERGYYVWGMLRAWQIQQRYLENHFKVDPALTGIFVRRILTHGGDTALKAKVAKIEDLARKVDEHHRSVQAELKKLQAVKAAGNKP